ncbi:MAG: acetyl-CoA C-acetyltransferase [Gammaproteobacteria bacterium]|nr:acetyl-CoA C-acetyltransferase [Gammaproteobacteria bacterium]
MTETDNSNNERTVYIVDGSRTPQLKVRNKPGPFHATELAIACARPLLTRQPFEPDAFDEIIMGCVMPGPDEVNIARLIALRLGCGEQTPAWTVQRNCASGMQALDCAAANIRSGQADLILAGGVEAMSHAPVLFNTAMVNWLGAWNSAKTLPQRLQVLGQLRPAFFKPVIGLLCGLSDPIVGLSMGQTAENLAYRFNINRDEMDAYAVRSHQRLTQAIKEGYLSEIEVLYDTHGKVYSHDDGVREDSSVEKLGHLQPVFDRPFGAVTAGNSAQITDGASILILASTTAVEKYNLKVRGEIKACQWAGLDPAQMGLGPVHAVTQLLQNKQLKLEDIDYWEINEAFAAQIIACLRAWEDKDYCRKELGLETALGSIDQERLNIDGGGISLGHPVGASGARIVLHLLSVLERKQAQRGIASLCIGGGQGGAMLIERFET